MNRTGIVLATGSLALVIGGCSSTRVADAEYPGYVVTRGGVSEMNVGYGDALGAAIFGKPVTVAKREQFGDTRFAEGMTELMPGE